jgi:hypothetical protein
VVWPPTFCEALSGRKSLVYVEGTLYSWEENIRVGRVLLLWYPLDPVIIKQSIKGFGFHILFSLKFICRTKVSKNLTGSQYVNFQNYEKSQFSICQSSNFWKHSVPLCRFSQTGNYLLIGFFYSRKLKLIFLNLDFIIFLSNEKITNIVTNTILTLNNILFIEVLHFNNFIPFKFTFKLFLTPLLDLLPFKEFH